MTKKVYIETDIFNSGKKIKNSETEEPLAYLDDKSLLEAYLWCMKQGYEVENFALKDGKLIVKST